MPPRRRNRSDSDARLKLQRAPIIGLLVMIFELVDSSAEGARGNWLRPLLESSRENSTTLAHSRLLTQVDDFKRHINFGKYRLIVR